MPEQQQDQPEKWSGLPDILLVAGLIVAAGSVALTVGTEMRWIGHAVTSTVGMVLMVVVVLTGAAQKGRIRTIRLRQIFRYHKMASTWFSLFVIGTFVLGLLTTLEHGEPLLESPHGIIGLVLVLMALVQLVPSLLIRKRARIRSFTWSLGMPLSRCLFSRRFWVFIRPGFWDELRYEAPGTYNGSGPNLENIREGAGNRTAPANAKRA